jgi:hypothetical protein
MRHYRFKRALPIRSAMLMVLFSALAFWVLPIVVGNALGKRKNRKGWMWGLFGGWLGVLVLASLNTREASEETDVEIPSSIAAAPVAQAAPSLPPAGWYNDPHASASLRWWDGTVWTDFTAAVPVPAG